MKKLSYIRDISTLIGVIAFLISFVCSSACVFVLSKRNAEMKDKLESKYETLYIQDADVVLITENEVRFEIANGNQFAIYDVEDWQVGDKAVLLFDNQGTETIYDDEIVRTFYRG